MQKVPRKHWKKWPSDQTPYVHWWWNTDSKLPANIRDFEPFRSTPRFDPFQLPRTLGLLRKGADNETPKFNNVKAVKLAAQNYGGGASVPVPRGSVNPVWPSEPGDLEEWITPEVIRRLPRDVPEDAVIVAVIDTGVALGHRALRRMDGTSRVISAWQQTAEFRHQSQEYLPFGEEWFAGDIDGKLRDHSRNRDLQNRLDEESFNRDLRLVEPHRIRGHRDLDHRASHGAHVMDLAAGRDPLDPHCEKFRLIVINLPTQYLHGSAGNFLMYFAAFGLARVFDIANALWRKNFPGKAGGFPVAVNLAYGMMAGPKDGCMPLELMMEEFVLGRQKANLRTSICMPAGNENLARAVAQTVAEPTKWSKSIPWRSQPSDQTSNYLEFWFRCRTGSPGDDLKEYSFLITAPNGSKFQIKGAKDNHYADLSGVSARLYCHIHRVGGHPRSVQFLLATSPTLIVQSNASVRTSPAGVWTIKLKCPVAADVAAYAQSDQSSTVQSKAGLRGYFDDPEYQPRLENGRLRDSYSYSPGSTTPPVDQEPAHALVTRKGSHNALAATVYNSTMAGYRLSDGQPALYSSTSAKLHPAIAELIQGAYPTDDSPALYGVLAAGARDGSSVTFRGTSMAAAQATRSAADEMFEWVTAGRPEQYPMVGSAGWHGQHAANGEQACPNYYGSVVPDKVGSGRARPLSMSQSHRWHRVARRFGDG